MDLFRPKLVLEADGGALDQSTKDFDRAAPAESKRGSAMWITQTYLKSPEPDAPLHIYYLFEDYKETHVDATKLIQEELEGLREI